MQRLFFIFFLALFCSEILGQNSIAGPKAREVLKEFYGTYSTAELEYGYVSFEKRREGWFVVLQKIESQELVPIDKFLFYNNRLKKYQSLPISKKESKEDIDPANYMNEYELRNFDAQFFYGYKGWYKDVINEFRDKKEISDDEMNGLARAYSIYAGGLLSDQSGDAPKNEIWDLPLSMNCLSPEQISRFNLLEAKAQELFKKLAVRNPAYETIVGKIGMKYANEIMFQYTILLAYANDYAMQMKLPLDLYTAEQLEIAKKNLEICPPGAILLSFGDNDYYPIHYLQKVQGFRKDVYLINYNLIGLDRYIYRITFPQYESKAIQLSVDTSFYKGNKNQLIYIRDSAFSFMFSNLNRLLKFSPKDEYNRVTLSADKILLSKDKQVNANGINIGDMAVISLKNVQYLINNQWILLDIIENLKGRKICFPNTFNDELKGLNEYLSSKGDLWIYNN
jgi:hypothetical protein